MSDELRDKVFRVHWRYGEHEDITGPDIATAFNLAGIGRGALPALDYWEELNAADTADGA